MLTNQSGGERMNFDPIRLNPVGKVLNFNPIRLNPYTKYGNYDGLEDNADIMETKFVIWPVDKKVKFYKELKEIKYDFNKEELKDATIAIMLGAQTVGYLNTENVLDLLYMDY